MSYNMKKKNLSHVEKTGRKGYIFIYVRKTAIAVRFDTNVGLDMV